MTNEQLAEALAKLLDQDRALVADLEQDATMRIAQERAKPKAWWVREDGGVLLTSDLPTDRGHPLIVTKNRIVGETPSDELEAMRLATSAIDAYYQNGEVGQRAIHLLLAKIEREAKANAAIAAAREDGA